MFWECGALKMSLQNNVFARIPLTVDCLEKEHGQEEWGCSTSPSPRAVLYLLYLAQSCYGLSAELMHAVLLTYVMVLLDPRYSWGRFRNSADNREF